MTLYKKCKWIAVSSLGILSFIWIFHCCFVREGDYQLYRAFRQKQHEIDTSSKFVSKNTYQTRSGVRKDIWLSDGKQSRLHHRIESKASILKLIPGERKSEVIEQLQGITCWMQDKLYFASEPDLPMQQVRYLEADQGVYRYTTQQFDADTVSLSLLRLPGHFLTFPFDAHAEPFLKGIAQNVSFSITEGTPQFQARNFKATLQGSEL
jgi:hypothetical protein